MTRNQAYQYLQDHDHGFLANVIAKYHKNVARKLRGAVNLIDAQHTVEVAQYKIDKLLIDGVTAPWAVLEEWASRKA